MEAWRHAGDRGTSLYDADRKRDVAGRGWARHLCRPAAHDPRSQQPDRDGCDRPPRASRDKELPRGYLCREHVLAAPSIGGAGDADPQSDGRGRSGSGIRCDALSQPHRGAPRPRSRGQMAGRHAAGILYRSRCDPVSRRAKWSVSRVPVHPARPTPRHRD